MLQYVKQLLLQFTQVLYKEGLKFPLSSKYCPLILRLVTVSQNIAVVKYLSLMLNKQIYYNTLCYD